MTEFWVSQKRHWCEFCKVWLNDTISARTTHENGVKHKDNVARKLREMRHKGESEKQEEELMKKTWNSIEAKAKAQYEKDVRAGLVAAPQGEKVKQAAGRAADSAAKAKPAAENRLTGGVLSKWEPDEGSGYLYNAALRYYYDKKSGWYYGGDPPSWTQSPAIPEVAMYREKQLQSGVGTAAAGQAGPSASKQQQAGGTAPRAGSSAQASKTYAHPLQSIGGHQFYQIGGKVGAARGLGSQGKDQGTAAKRKAPEPAVSKTKGKTMSKEEAEALARREAARARVEKRTMKQFGLT